MKKGSFISKEEAIMLQAIAVMLMVFHHLFGFPERVHVPYIMVFDFGTLHVETLLSYFGRICIGMFAFISGYGMSKVAYSKIYKKHRILSGYKFVFHQLKKLFIRFWIVCLVFLPIGYALKVYQFDWFVLVKTLLGISSAYNAEWWYIGYYLLFLLFFPLASFALSSVKKMSSFTRKITLSTVAIALTVGYILLPKKGIWTVMLCFIFGMLVLEMELLETFYAWLLKTKSFRYIIALSGILFSVLLRTVIGANCDYDFLFVPILFFFLIVLLKGKWLKNSVDKVLLFIGKYSTYIWLTHTFYAYYYFQAITYCPRYSTLIFIWCLFLSSVTGMVLEKAVRIIEYGIQRSVEKRDRDMNDV